jgi:2'-hydroxyisoflavone reductase
MRILVLGGTGFVGRHIVQAARERGHHVTVFNRARRPLPWPDVEQRVGDRDEGDLAAIESGEWDACVDVNAYLPQAVAATTSLLGDRIERYCLISTGSVYRAIDEPGGEPLPIDESSPLHDPPAAAVSERTPELYGPLKVACEGVAEAAYGDCTLIIRPGIVAGPYDPTKRFDWWVGRLARGGETLAPGDPDGPVMVVDGRDLGAFTVSCLERAIGGTFNVCGDPVTFAAFLDALIEGTGSTAALRWVGEDALLAAGVEPFTEIPLWLPESPGHRAFYSLANGRARAAGFAPRSLAETARATLAWLDAVASGDEPEPVPTGFVARGLAAERERALLARA